MKKRTLLAFHVICSTILIILLLINLNKINVHLGASSSDSEISIFWSFITKNEVSSIVVGDVNNDNKLEIIVGTYGKNNNLYCIEGDSGILLWKISIDSKIVGIALGNVDKDDYLEIISSCINHRIYCVDGKTGDIQWEFVADNYIFPPILCDTDKDNECEIIFGSVDNHVYCLSGDDGILLWKFKTKGWAIACAVGDINNDYEKEIIVVDDYYNPVIYCIDGNNGTLIWSSNVESLNPNSLLLADINMDHKMEIIFGNLNGNLYYLNYCGILISKFNARVGIKCTPAIGDLDGDGKPEIVVGESILCCLNGEDGSLLWKFEPTYFKNASVLERIKGIALGDLNGDNKLDVIISSNVYYFNKTTNKWSGFIYCLDGKSGVLIWKFKFTGWPTSPVLADVNCDSRVEIIFGTTNGTVFCLRIKNAGFRIYWQGDSGDIFFHNSRNQLLIDKDFDFLSDYSEKIIGCDPFDADTDDDGITDGLEIYNNMNPLLNYRLLEISVIISLITIALTIFTILVKTGKISLFRRAPHDFRRYFCTQSNKSLVKGLSNSLTGKIFINIEISNEKTKNT